MTPRYLRPLFLALWAIAVIAKPVLAAEPDPAVLSYKLPADLKWNDNPTYPGLKTAVLYGDPTKPGPYATINRFPPGVMSRPHSHPNDRYILVLKGTWWIGTGEKFDPASTKPMPVGSFVVHNAGKIHYDGARDEQCEVLIYGEGPGTSTPAGKPAGGK